MKPRPPIPGSDRACPATPPSVLARTARHATRSTHEPRGSPLRSRVPVGVPAGRTCRTSLRDVPAERQDLASPPGVNGRDRCSPSPPSADPRPRHRGPKRAPLGDAIPAGRRQVDRDGGGFRASPRSPRSASSPCSRRDSAWLHGACLAGLASLGLPQGAASPLGGARRKESASPVRRWAHQRRGRTNKKAPRSCERGASAPPTEGTSQEVTSASPARTGSRQPEPARRSSCSGATPSGPRRRTPAR